MGAEGTLSDPLLVQREASDAKSHLTAGNLDADVLVVGAGPVGLLTAIELTQRKVKVAIIDRWPEQEIKTKAIGVAKASLQIFPIPVARQIEKEACKPKGSRVTEVVGSESTTIIAITGSDKPAKNEYAPLYTIEQWKTERFLEKFLNGLGVQIQRPVVLKDFEQTDSCVECVLSFEGGQHVEEGQEARQMRVSYLVGCDGGASFVRKKLGFEFQGDVAKASFVSAHCRFDKQAGKEDWSDIFFGKNVPGGNPLVSGFCVSLPLNNNEHLINLDLDEEQQKGFLLDEVDAHGLRKLKELTIDDILDMFRARTGCPETTVKPENVIWIAHYRVNSRLAEHFGAGRVYLAGDACHCHSPVGGQGMNMGLQDAKNLAWKLATVIKKQASPSLLSTYEQERRGIDAVITKAVHAGTSLFSHRNPLVFFLRGRPQRVIGATISVVPDAAKTSRGWSYSGSPLAQEHWERPDLLNTLRDILRGPFKIYRRRQNLFRWSAKLGGRISAGDSIPPVMLDPDDINITADHLERHGGMQHLYDVVRSSPGWTLLIFEGSASANKESSANGLPIWSFDQLVTMGEEVQEADGGGLVDKVIVFPSSDFEAHETFSILAQCLLLVRPDLYVGLRSEPVRKGAITRYLTGIGAVGLPPASDECPPGTTVFDPLPAAIALVVLAIAISVYFFV
ncbi:hypothetical protein EMIHUDRAFT_212567 [Emiliania huxleyi CCMP1516]|uniref:FAD-binding domain-containing protein n=2 Tax=Emiliania huxleyi TaxID=2903 RepID=A0A0D3IQF3_EMIH1|nr:hypothetical protein EMIHUDRAFT_212567 [Emiliania huxleyi CCMP1516]EOD13488.1 hypothetical protein EMIHUDRAFT_212567 [Emiliania huxleyi CCMP1516]|eukprot:XP_005765917.1 hypothetical protein EMIHUDRAFT_212567 [Emiliania huxleyi CCMP1516]